MLACCLLTAWHHFSNLTVQDPYPCLGDNATHSGLGLCIAIILSPTDMPQARAMVGKMLRKESVSELKTCSWVAMSHLPMNYGPEQLLELPQQCKLLPLLVAAKQTAKIIAKDTAHWLHNIEKDQAETGLEASCLLTDLGSTRSCYTGY